MTDRGSIGLVLAGVVGVVLLFAAALGSVGAYYRVRIEVTAAADAAALAAAPVTFLPFGATGTPLDEAQRFAAANGARVVRCTCPLDESWDPRTVEVEVERVIDLWPAGRLAVRAIGRAEFVPALLLAE
jgi:hypothetical protein